MSLHRIAAALPGMGGVQIGPVLEQLASDVPEGQAIVEVGCWLGAGTAHLALGARDNGTSIHCFDRWKANLGEVRVAGRFGVALERGQDTLPRVRESLRPFGADINWHQGGLRKSSWHGQTIGLYVDDASKSPELWHHAAKTFIPHVPVGGFLVLMDFYFFETRGARYKAQYRWMATRGDRFKQVGDHVGGTSTAIFERVA